MSPQPKYWLKAKRIVFSLIAMASGALASASTDVANLIKVYFPKANPQELDAWAALIRSIGMSGLIGGGGMAVRSTFTERDPLYTDRFLPGPNREDFDDRPPSV